MSLPPAGWPLRAHSRAVRTDGLDWHVQVCGSGPEPVLLLHGTGGSAHSWSALVPLLLQGRATVVVPDLPGHAFTRGRPPGGLTLAGVSAALHALLQALAEQGGVPAATAPRLVVGHSAGAALGLRMALDAAAPVHAVLGFAPSLIAPPALYTRWIGPLLHPLVTSAPVGALVARLPGRSRLIDGLLQSTGSRLSDAQRAPYRTLFADPQHVRGAVGFMAAAELAALCRAAEALPCPAAFVLGRGDRWIPEAPLRRVIARHLPTAAVDVWPGGHLLHEEHPERAAERIRSLLPAPR